MFLDWVSSLDLLEQGKETNILRDFSLPVRRILVSQVVNLFLDPNTSPSILTTNAHVHWVMECIGQGFLLPVDDLPVIVACIDLYKRWLLESNVKPRPPPISENEQHFTRVMLQHLSLIFTPRVGVPKENTDVHTVLCQRVLSIFLEFSRTCKPSTETWDVVLKLLLGTSDCLLGGERGADENQTKAIAPFLLKVVFEVWLHARTTDPELWGSLVRLTAKWLHWMPMAAQWNATTLGLTNRLLTLLYPSPDTAVQQFPYVTVKSSESDYVNIDLSPDLVYYAWHRMFHVMGNLNSLSNPAIFVCAMTGLNNLVCQFLKVGRTPDQRDKPDVSRPDGNTILHIFGSWLFEAVKLNRTSFDEGTSIAVETLNHIFNACQHYKLEPVYLASYYTCMAEALGSDGRVLMSAIQYGQWLVFSELPGARVLVPLYISAVSKILPLSVPYHPSVTPPDVIRRCCIKIIGGLICLPNRFGDLTIPNIHNKPANTVSQKALADIVSYKDTLPHLSHLLLAGLSSEKNPHNSELLLWYIPIFLREIAAAVQGGGGSPVSPAEFTVGAVEVIIANICGNTWPYEVSQAACRVLSSLSRMYTCFSNGPELGYSITKSLCEYAIGRIGLTPQDEELCSAVIMSVTDWIVVDQWLITKRGALDVFIDVCMLGLGARDHTADNEPSVVNAPAGTRTTMSPIKKVRAPPGEKLKQAAQHGLLNVLHNMGNFPAATGPSRISSMVSEEDVLLKIKELDPTVTDPEEFVRYFIVDESCMISVIDIPNGTSDPTCVIVIRDRTGKYVWNANKPYLPFTPKKDVDQEEKDPELLPSESTDDLTRGLGSPVRVTPGGPGSNSNSPSLTTRPRALVSEGSQGDLKLLVAVEADLSSRNHVESYQDMITYISGHSDETFLTLAEGVLQNETSLLDQFKDQTMAVSIATNPPARRNPYLGPCKFQLGRQLLASLGLFSPCHSKVVPLHPGPALSACMKAMDSIAERAQYKVGVIYAGKGQTVDEVFANVQGSADYNRFIASLGWPVHLPTHKGFNGGLDGKGHLGLEAPYYASYSLETIFLVTSFMPNQFLATEPTKPVTTHKKNLLRGTPVVVVWSEDYKFDTTTLTEGVPLQIVIIPQSSGMFRVKILKTTSISKIPIGPISEDVVVSRQVLGDMVRETAIVASQLIFPVPHPYANRRNYIEQMSRSFKSPNMAVDAFYGKIFGAMPKTTFQPVVGIKDGARRPPHAGVLKGITPPPPPPSVQSSVTGTPEKFTHMYSTDFLLQPASDVNMPRNLSETSLSNHPINSLNSSVSSLNSSGDSVKSFDGEPVKRVPSFGTKEPTPPTLIPVSSTPPSALSNPLLSQVGISAKSHSMSELPAHDIAAAHAAHASKPGSPSPPTSPPLATSPGSATPPNTFLRAKISRSGSPLVGRPASEDVGAMQTPTSPQQPSSESISSVPTSAFTSTISASSSASSSSSSSSSAPSSSSTSSASSTSTTPSRPSSRPGLFVLGRGNKQ